MRYSLVTEYQFRKGWSKKIREKERNQRKNRKTKESKQKINIRKKDIK